MQLKNRNPFPESVAISLVIGCISLIPSQEVILQPGYTLILTASLFISFWHGRLPGLTAFFLSFAIRAVFQIFYRHVPFQPAGLLLTATTGTVLCYLGGSLNQFRRYRIEKVMSRFRNLSGEKTRLKKISVAQQDIIRELEERVTRQRTSLNLLYDRIQEVDCLDTSKSISNLMDTLVHFTEADRLSLWVFDNRESVLKLKMRKGAGSGEQGPEVLSLKDTIEGWVFRNNQLFSIRMALDYDTLARLNTENSIICCPVVLDNRTWGVINIESLPFVKYSSYTENLIQIIISLAQPALKRALDFESLLMGEEENEYTGLPQFTQLYRVLEKSRFEEEGTYNSASLLILELQNYRELVDRFGLQHIQSMQAELLKELADRQPNQPELFHYREEHRMAIFIPHLDYDGCSLFCLESVEYINNRQWEIEGQKLSLDINLGYASSGTSEKMDPDDMLKRAEYLLEIQKI